MIQPQDNFARAVTSPTLLSVYETWKTLAAGRIGPRRGELTPAQLRRAMPSTFTVEVIDGGKDFRFGFAGDRVMQFLDRRCAAPTLAGLTGTSFFAGADRLLRQCVDSKKPLISGPKPTTYSGKEYLEREVLLLPLSEDGAAVTGILGAFETWLLGTHPHAMAPVLAE
jgi:hypothetical protein